VPPHRRGRSVRRRSRTTRQSRRCHFVDQLSARWQLRLSRSLGAVRRPREAPKIPLFGLRKKDLKKAPATVEAQLAPPPQAATDEEEDPFANID
jgi:hypothetical protein